MLCRRHFAVEKIGNLDRRSPALRRKSREFRQTRPFGRIVHVDVERQAVTQAVNEVAVHGIVHGVGDSTLHSFAPQTIGGRIGDGMEKVFRGFAFEQAFGALKQRKGVFLRKGFRAADALDATVRPRRGTVELQQDRHSALGGDERVVGMSQQTVAAGRHAGDGGKAHHAIAAMKTEELRDGPDGVRGIGVTAVPTTGTIERRGHVVAGEKRTPIVKVRPFAMRDRAEDAATVHIEGSQREPVVTTVFGHETMPLRGFRRAHQLPTVSHCGGSRHFDRHVLAAAHRLDGHSRMIAPICTYIYKVYVLTATKFAPRLRVCRSFGQGASLLSQQFECRRDRCGIGIDYCAKFRSIDIGIARQGGSSALTGADQPDAHRGNRRAR